MAKKTKKPKRKTKKKSKRATKARAKRKIKRIIEPKSYIKITKTRKKELGHKPLIAAILNFFTWGAGFMYVGRVIYGFLWLVAAITLLIPLQMIYSSLPTQIASYMTTGYFFISLLLAWDAYFDEVVKWQMGKK